MSAIAHDGGDRSPSVEYRDGTVVGILDLFKRGEGRRAGAAAPSGGDVRQDDPSS